MMPCRRRRTESNRHNRVHIEGWFRIMRALGLDGYCNASVKIGIGRSIALNGSRDGFRTDMDDGRASIDG
jgi:hypothetical protein